MATFDETLVAPEFIVSTDLDGTLLDHHTYDWQAALPAVHLLTEQHIPIIFNTSKTLDEVLALQQATNIRGPAIVENGSALYLPKHYFTQEFIDDGHTPVRELEDYWQLCFGTPLENIVGFIQSWRKVNGNILEGYTDWNVEKVMAATNLPRNKATLSMRKAFSEPFVWHGNSSQLSKLTADADAAQLQILQGGRFYHLQGQTDKGKPLLWLVKQYQKHMALSPKLICLGDNKNDIQMLNIADYAVCVKSPVSPYPSVHTHGDVIYTSGKGPVGWTEAITQILRH